MTFTTDAQPSQRSATPIPFNPTPWQQLTDAANDGIAIEALLLEYDPDGKEEKMAWGFLINPQSLDIENTANYGEVAPHATTVSTKQYSHTKGRTFTTPGMMFSLWCYKKSVKSLLDGLDKLMQADPANDRFAPALLRFSWGSYDLGPLSLVKYSYRIIAVSGGDPTDVRDLTLTFEEQPRPLTQAEQEEKAQQRAAQAKEDRLAQGGPRNPLTERQQSDAEARAKAFLERNIEQFSADVQSLVRSGEYTLQVSQDNGVVMLLDGEAKIGVVSQFDGTNHKVGGQITSVPLKEGGSVAVGAIGKDGSVGAIVAETDVTPAGNLTPAAEAAQEFRTTR